MDRIGLVGTSYRTAHVDELAAAALPADFDHEQLTELARLAGFTELVYLGTCNRVEFYFRGETRIHTEQLLFHLGRSLADLTDGATQLPDRERLYIHFGRPAVRHLFRVTAALDSMMVGEAQITGQAKEAHERAHDIGLLGGILDQTFHEAFHLAKRIRTETELTRRPVSLVTLVERRLHDHLENSAAPALILGAGEMAGQALRLIRNTDPTRLVLVANRTPERARELVARDPDADALFLDATLANPPGVGLVIAATSSDQVMISRAQIESLRARLDADERMLLIDLAMPPNLDPEARAIPGVDLHGIEEMRDEAERNRQLRLAEMDRCEKLVDHQLETLRSHLLDRALSPAARYMRASFNEVAERAVRHSLSKDLSHLEPADREAVERMAAGLVKRLVQVPLRGLKGAAKNHSSAVIDGFLAGLESRMDGNGGRSS
ncbi:MAG: glutamyl-tRNA reductase [Holophagae bacterium]